MTMAGFLRDELVCNNLLIVVILARSKQKLILYTLPSGPEAYGLPLRVNSAIPGFNN